MVAKATPRFSRGGMEESNYSSVKIKVKRRVSNKYITFAAMKYNELFRLLKREGWFEVRQKGSHVILQHPDKLGQLIVPYHVGKEVKKGLLTAILKQANIKTNKR